MIKNAFYSFGINFINLLTPVLLIPFYVEIFGLSVYGVIAVITSLLNYIYIITDYSFGTYGPIELVKLNYSKDLANKYISKLLNTRLFLSILAIFVFLFVFSFLSNIEVSFCAFFSFPLLIFSRSQDIRWVFIGINKMSIYFYLYILFKLSGLFVVVLFVSKENGFESAFYIIGFFDTLLFLFSYLYLYLYEEFRYHITSVKEIVSLLKEGNKMFLTNLSVASLSNSTTLILSFIVDSNAVAIYSIAEKIIMLLKNCTGVLFLAVFPRLCAIGVKNVVLLKKTLVSILKGYVILFVLAILFLLIFSDTIISIFSLNSVNQIKIYLFCLLPLPLIAAVGQPAYFTLLLYDKKNNYFYAYFLPLIFTPFLTLILGAYLEVYGAIISLIITELFIVLYMYKYVLQNNLLNFFKTSSSFSVS